MILALLIATLFNVVSSTSAPCSGTTYSVPFPYGASGSTPDLVVTAGGITLSYPAGWSINKVSSTSTGTITLAAACTGTVTITRKTPRTQIVNFATQGRLDTGILTATLDRIEMQMQESIVTGGDAFLSSLTLTTPLSLASGGTGAALPACGAGFLTSDGTVLSCAIPAGLAVPGAVGAAIQPLATTTTNPIQAGNIHINGNLVVGSVNPSSALLSSITVGFPPGSDRLYMGQGAVGALAGGATWSVYPSDYNTNSTSTSRIFEVYGRKNNQPTFYVSGQAAGSLAVPAVATSGCASGNGCTNIQLSGCGDGEFGAGIPCITTQAGNGIATPLFLAGRYGNSDDTNKVVVTTGGVNRTSGTIFEIVNQGVQKLGVGFNGNLTLAGTTTTTGVTSSGPVSGTTLTSSGLATLASATVTGVSTHTGATALNGGATIGTSGTAISGSFRGTLAVGGGTIAAGACVDQILTVTGAAVGADCAIGQQLAAPAGTISQCSIDTANQCRYHTCNYTAAGIAVGAQTLSCRVFNP